MTAQDRIHDLNQKYIDACNSGNLDALMKTMTDDILYQAPGRPPMENLQEVKTWVKDEFFDPFTVDFNAEFDRIEVVGDHAYAPGTFRLDLTPKSGGDQIHLTGEFFDVVQKEGGDWKLKQVIFNYDQPVPSPEAEHSTHSGAAL